MSLQFSSLCRKERLRMQHKVGSSITALQRSCQKEYTQEQNRTFTLHPISSSQKLPAHNPVWQVNAASQAPEPASGDLERPHRNFHFMFVTSVQYAPTSECNPTQNGSQTPLGQSNTGQTKHSFSLLLFIHF